MKKRFIFKTLLLSIITFGANCLSVCAKENLPAPGVERLEYVVQMSGKPPVGMYIGFAILAVLIVVAIIYYKHIEKREENGEK